MLVRILLKRLCSHYRVMNWGFTYLRLIHYFWSLKFNRSKLVQETTWYFKHSGSFRASSQRFRIPPQLVYLDTAALGLPKMVDHMYPSPTGPFVTWNSFLSFSRKVVFMGLFSYFIARVITSVDRLQRKEVWLHSPNSLLMNKIKSSDIIISLWFLVQKSNFESECLFWKRW